MEIISYLISEDGEVYGKTSSGDIIRFATIEKLTEIITATYEQCVKDNMDDSKQMFWNVCKLAGLLVAKNIITQEEMNEIMKMEIPEEEKNDLDKNIKNDMDNN